MFFYQGLSCPHCQQPFEEHDDVVACPICGAPHHRDCWKEHGGCACADAHGTPAQWTREQAKKAEIKPEIENEVESVTCPRCGSQNPEGRTLCNICGTALKKSDEAEFAPFGTNPSFYEYAPFHIHQPPCGGVAPETEIRGETAADLEKIVAVNAPYYMPRFARMAKGASVFSWNWSAFLFPDYWLLFRKHYVAGALVLLFRALCFCVLNSVSYTIFADIMQSEPTDITWEKMEAVVNAMDPTLVMWISVLFLSIGVTLFLLHVLGGLFGNFLYLKHGTRLIKNSRKHYPEGYRAQLSVKGGTSFTLAIVGFMCFQLLTNFFIIL